MTHEFSYTTAFTRNIGWLTEWEQDTLRSKRVAIAGMGGVGGAHLLTLARLGIGGFHVADFDTFDLPNFNRQVGAMMSTVGRSKLTVMAEMALDINPELALTRFPEGVTAASLDDFLSGIDLYVDALDFFELDVRRMVFRRCAELGIPAITAAPIGMGTNWLTFTPGGMTFDQYFQLEGQPQAEQYLRFLIGLAPSGSHRQYLVDPSRIDLARKIGPSTAPSCLLCAGVVGVEAVKILLHRGGVQPAPVHHLFDPYLGKFQRVTLRWGMAGPLQRAKLAIARRIYLRQAAPQSPRESEPELKTPIQHILNRARWAPSGDNEQPWRFEITGPEEANIWLIVDPSNPYEYRGGEPSLLSLGGLLETARLAASSLGRQLDYKITTDCDKVTVQVRAPFEPGLKHDILDTVVAARSVNRQAMGATPLTAEEKESLARALGPDFKVQWFESTGARWNIARLNARVTDVRLRAPEFFPVHQRVIDWADRYSASGIPAGAVGLNRATLKAMRWAMRDWKRMTRLNYIAGTAGAQVQLDLWPGLRSAAFFAISPIQSNQLRDAAFTIRCGAAIQRFWLTATLLRLGLQPATATLAIAHFGAMDNTFTQSVPIQGKAKRIAQRFEELFGAPADQFMFIGRLGQLPHEKPSSRSTRQPLSALLHSQ